MVKKDSEILSLNTKLCELYIELEQLKSEAISQKQNFIETVSGDDENNIDESKYTRSKLCLLEALLLQMNPIL